MQTNSINDISQLKPLTYATVMFLLASVTCVGCSEAAPPPRCDTPTAPFCSAEMSPISGWTGHVFHLSQNYPSQIPPDKYPWLRYSPTKQPIKYLRAALRYFYAGNIRPDTEDSFDPKLNTVRKWYNAPWQDFGLNGREFVHGLTRERSSRPYELANTQTSEWANYAVGFYNAPGGYTLGRVWRNHGNPQPALAIFPYNTIAAKLLFTTATPAEVPYLAGAPKWEAYIYANPHQEPTPDSPRRIEVLRLLQIDIAVRDRRVNSTTGWVFGTFVYGGGPGGIADRQQKRGWNNVEPVGIMWGNDPGYDGKGQLTETSLNPSVRMPHVGYQGRLNGPVDNPDSSCLSCHSTAEIPAGTMIPDPTNQAYWFRNIPAGLPFDPGRQSVDYSLQIEVGIENFDNAMELKNAKSPEVRERLRQRLNLLEETSPRNGGETN